MKNISSSTPTFRIGGTMGDKGDFLILVDFRGPGGQGGHQNTAFSSFFVEKLVWRVLSLLKDQERTLQIP